MKIEEAIEKLKESKRGFNQTYDLILNLRNIDLKKPENRISKEIALPHGRGKPVSVCIFSDKFGIGKSKIEEMAENKKNAKKLAKRYDFFLASADLMPTIGRILGRYLAPAGKMPQPFPPNLAKEQIEALSKRKEMSIRVNLKTSPHIQVPVGTEGMETEQIKENVDTVLKEVIDALPKGRSQIKNILLKKTMSKPIKIEVG